MNKKTSAIVQARMNSERLAGKILAPISGVPLLLHVIERLKKVHGLEGIIIATTDRKEDDGTEEFCRAQGIKCFRGDSEDVLKRFIDAAAEAFGVDVIARICADNPLFDVPFLARMLEEHLKSGADVTYSSASVPIGSTQEVASFEALKRASLETNDPKCREHVTPYLKENPDRFKNLVLEPPDYLAGHPARLTVDTAADLELARKIYERLYKPGSIVDLKDALALLDSNPDWMKINSAVRQKGWKE
ncbi:MAG: glycosyltransferase family protein [Nitrospinae bacterium]|nr:glycosyltransferase family protein [Nitrospinota bacterium]